MRYLVLFGLFATTIAYAEPEFLKKDSETLEIRESIFVSKHELSERRLNLKERIKEFNDEIDKIDVQLALLKSNA